MLGKVGSVAAQAYVSSQKLQAGAAASDAPDQSFGNMLADTLSGAVQSGRSADGLKARAAAGTRPELLDVVTATAESEVALETLVAVRDKVIQAYDDIMRMPI